MPRYRKKVVEIEAIQLTWPNWQKICEFVPKPWFVRGCYVDKDGKETEDINGRLGLVMQTQNTQQFIAVEGDYIIKGVEGEYYPCKASIFEATHEPA